MDVMAEQIGAMPKWWKYAITDPYLAYIIWYGPAFNCHYRLDGPHRWDQARNVAIRMYKQWRQRKGDGYYFGRWLSLAAVVTVVGAGVVAKRLRIF